MAAAWPLSAIAAYNSYERFGVKMMGSAKPEWEITMRHAGNVVLAVPLAVGAALIVWKLSFFRVISSTLGLIFFVVSAIVFAVIYYSILERYWNRPAQLAKTIPINSKELRQRTKQFYDNLRKG